MSRCAPGNHVWDRVEDGCDCGLIHGLDAFWCREYTRKAEGGVMVASGRPVTTTEPDLEKIAAHVLGRLGLRLEHHLLDVGCGPGALWQWLAPACARLVGVEPVEALREHSPWGEIRPGRAECLPLWGERFDRGLVYSVLQHLPFAMPALSELALAIRPGGVVLLGDVPDLTVRAFVLPGYLRGLLEAGLPVEETTHAIDRNLRATWYDPERLASDARIAGFDVRVWPGLSPARFDLVLTRR